MQIKHNISTEAVMLEIKHVAGDEHEVEIQDRSKIFSLFWFLATARKVYGSRKENKVKTIICHWKQFPLNLWSRNQAYLYREIPVWFKWKINVCRKFCIFRTSSRLIPGSKWRASKSLPTSKLRTISTRSRREDILTNITKWNGFEFDVASNVKTLSGSLRLSAFWCEDRKNFRLFLP